MHEEGVWALAVDEEFNTFYSGGKEGKVFATEIDSGEGREGRKGGERRGREGKRKIVVHQSSYPK